MPNEYLQKRAPDDHPNRCQGLDKFGQCHNFAVPNSDKCIYHGGQKHLERERKQALKNYRVQMWQARIQDKLNSPELKNLSEEISILRVLLEERLNACKSTTDLMMHAATISDLVLKIEKVVFSCHKLETSLNVLLDKKQILQFAEQIIQILTEEISDPDILETVAKRVAETVNPQNLEEQSE